MAAAALSKMMIGQETAAVAAQGVAMAEALAPAAWAKLVVEPGAAGIATGLLTAGLSAAAGVGAASNAVTSFGSGTQSMGNFNFGESGLGEKPFAAGGVVTAPTHALIGENLILKRYCLCAAAYCKRSPAFCLMVWTLELLQVMVLMLK